MNKYFVLLTAALLLVSGVAHAVGYNSNDPAMNDAVKASIAAQAPAECPLIKAAQLERSKRAKANLAQTADAGSSARSSNDGPITR